MTVNLEQANALIEEYKSLVTDLQGEIIALRNTIKELEFEMECLTDKFYEV